MADRRPSNTDPKMPKTVKVPHLGGIDVSYRMPKPYRQYKPTLVLINSFTTTAEIFRSQFGDDKVADVMNLVAVEPLGHGDTRAKVSDTFTYWDSAIMTIQAMDALGIKQAFVLGMSQGGWIAARMALYAPDRVTGLILTGTTMDSENQQAVKLGSWDAWELLTPLVKSLTTNTAVNDFSPTDDYCNFLVDNSFGGSANEETRKTWTELIKKNYAGDAGRKRLREAAINLRERDGLHGRVPTIKCPILWMHGDEDKVYALKAAQQDIELFESSSNKKFVVVKGGPHFLVWTHSDEINAGIVEFVTKNSQGMKPSGRALREAVGMVEM